MFPVRACIHRPGRVSLARHAIIGPPHRPRPAPYCGRANCRRRAQAVIAAYPDALARHDGRVIVFRDGTILPVHDGVDKSDARQLHRASILDQFHHAYPRGLLTAPPLTDPGPGGLSQRGLHQQDIWRLPQWRGASAAGRGALTAEDLGQTGLRHAGERCGGSAARGVCRDRRAARRDQARHMVGPPASSHAARSPTPAA